MRIIEKTQIEMMQEVKTIVAETPNKQAKKEETGGCKGIRAAIEN